MMVVDPIEWWVQQSTIALLRLFPGGSSLKRYMASADCRRIIAIPCASIWLFLFASRVLAQDGLPPNLFLNPDFSHGTSSWRLERIPPAAATLDVLAEKPQVAARGSAVRINVSALGAEKWHAQFFQTGLGLLDGEPYTLAFWAKSDRPRKISIKANI